MSTFPDTITFNCSNLFATELIFKEAIVNLLTFLSLISFNNVDISSGLFVSITPRLKSLLLFSSDSLSYCLIVSQFEIIFDELIEDLEEKMETF